MFYSGIQHTTNFFLAAYHLVSNTLSSLCSRISNIASSIFGYKNETSSAENLATSRVQSNPTTSLIPSAITSINPAVPVNLTSAAAPATMHSNTDNVESAAESSSSSIRSMYTPSPAATSFRCGSDSCAASQSTRSSQKIKQTHRVLLAACAHDLLRGLNAFQKKFLIEVITVLEFGDRNYTIEFS